MQKSSKDGWTAADERRARGHVNERTAEINALWRDLSEQFERAVLNGDADWFERQAKAIRSGDTRSDDAIARDRFEAAVARELEMAFWEGRAAKQPPLKRRRGPFRVTDEMLEEARKRQSSRSRNEGSG